MSNVKKYLALLGLGFLYQSMYLLPYLRYVFYDAMIEASGFTNTQLGVMITAYTITATISNFFTGALADRFDVKKLLVLAGISHVAMSLLYLATIQSYMLTLVIWAGQGVTTTLLLWAPIFKAIRELGTAEEQSSLFGFFDMFTGVAGFAGNFGAIWVFSMFADGVSALKGVVIFYTALVAVAVVMVIAFYRKEESAVAAEKIKKTEKKEKPSIGGVVQYVLRAVKLPQVWLMGVVMFAFYGFYSTASYFVPYATAVLGMTSVAASIFGNMRSYGIRLVAGPIAGTMAKKLGSPTKGIAINSALTIIAMVVLCIATGSTSSLPFFLALAVIVCLFSLMVKAQYMAPQEEMGIPLEVTGMAITLMSILGITGPDLFLPALCGSWIDQYGNDGYLYIFMLMTGLAILGLVAAILMLKVKQKNAQKETRETVSA